MKIKMILGLALATATFSAGFAYSSALSDAVIGDMLVDATEAKIQSIQDARVIESLQADKSHAVMEIYALENREFEVVERVVTNEVIQYVQTDNARECGVSADGVRIADIAATGLVPEIPDASSGTDVAPEGVTNGEFIQVVAENYGDCRSNGAQLAALQAWIRQTTEPS